MAVTAITLATASCSWLESLDKDPTADWSADKLYTEARAALEESNWTDAKDYYTKLEARYPFGTYAQQAQIELIYANWKDGDAAQAVQGADRFLQAYPNHANSDYVMYLKALATLNENDGWFAKLAAQDLAERDAKTDDAAAHSGSPASNEGRGNPIDAVLSLFSGSGVDSMLDAFLARPTQQLDKVDCTMPSSDSADKLIAKLTELGGIGIARMDAKTPEFTSAAASKGAALVELCRRLGIDPSRAVAFGDSGNDLSMCGRGITFVAMGNATAEVKAAADEQTDTVWEDGVATWLEPRLGISAPEASA